MTAVRGKKYLQVAKNRYSGDLGIVPLDFDKDALSYQAKKKSKNKQEEPEKLLDQYFDEYSLDDTHTEGQSKTNKLGRNKFQNRKQDAASYLSEILNQDSNR